MLIGIDASRAFLDERTGIEEYSYQVIKHLRNKLGKHRVVLYIRKNQKSGALLLPKSWTIKMVKWPWLWTQIGLSLEMLFHPVDVLFIPAHVIPFIHPQKTIVTIHGLEYEMMPEAYSFWQKLYMRWSIKKSCHWASKIIAVSKNTKKDLVKLYKVSGERVEVIYNGVRPIRNYETYPNLRTLNARYQILDTRYLLFIGRLEERKNICGIIEAYRILKEKYNIPHSLVLAGSPGRNYGIIKLKIRNCLKIKNLKLKIVKLGYVNENLKWQLMPGADVFLFPTFYEGFGLPVLEAQSAGVPAIASNNSSIPEITVIKNLPRPLAGEDARRAGEGNFSAILVNPHNPTEIAEATYKLISDRDFRDGIIKRGRENVKRFSWERCAVRIANLLVT